MLRILALLAGLVLASPALAASGDCGGTINPAVPAANSALTSAPMRIQFQAARADISALQALVAGTTPPASPCLWQLWADTTTSPATVKQWNGTTWLVAFKAGETIITTGSILGVSPVVVTVTAGVASISIDTSSFPTLAGTNVWTGVNSFSNTAKFTSDVWLNGGAGAAGQIPISAGSGSPAGWGSLGSILSAGSGVSFGGTSTNPVVNCATAGTGTPGCITLDGDASHYVDGTGTLSTPAGAGAGTPSNVIGRCGSFAVWQRYPSGTTAKATGSTAGAYYLNDGWYVKVGNAEDTTVTQSAAIVPGVVYSAKVQRNVGKTDTTKIYYACPLGNDEIAAMQGKYVASVLSILEGANQSFGHSVGYALYCGTGAPAKRGSTPYTGETTVISGTITTTTTAQTVSATSAAVVPTNCTQAEWQLSFTPTGTAGLDDSITVAANQLATVASSATPSPAYSPTSIGIVLPQAERFLCAINAGKLSSMSVGVGQSIAGIQCPQPLRTISPAISAASTTYTLNELGSNYTCTMTGAAQSYTSVYASCASSSANVAGTPGVLNFNSPGALYFSGEI